MRQRTKNRRSRRDTLRLRILLLVLLVAALFIAAQMGVSQSQAPSWDTGHVVATTDASGWVTVTHGLGVVPSFADVSVENPNSGGPRPDVRYVTSYTATTFRVRFIREGGGSAYSNASVRFNWFVTTDPVAPTTTTTAPTTTATTTTIVVP